MKVVLLAGLAPNQVALAAKINAAVQLQAIVFEKRKSAGRINLTYYINAIADRFLFSAFRNAWFAMQEYYVKHFNVPKAKSLTVTSVNDADAYRFIVDAKPDLIVVSGTGLIKEKLLSLKPKFGILNLHTGLSPYVKGGPNCTNWCLAENKMHLIGNTVMYIDAGIDSGNIIASEFTPLSGDESLQDLHIKVMEHAHDLYIRCIKLIVEQKGLLTSVKQSSIAKGKTYFTKDWTFFKKQKALLNLKKLKKSAQSFEKNRKGITTVNPFN